jgi:phenylacetic acid degradation operon negative regulatory protein
MLREGWGQAAANVMVRPFARAASRDLVSGARDTITLVAQPQSAENARALASACWQLDALDAAYRGFLKDFGPVAGEISEGVRLADAQAFQLRTLLIHDWRRIVLRDPLLPHAMLSADWPGKRALELVSAVYRQVLAGAERWLDRHAVNEDGPLPPAQTLVKRFGAA